MQNLKTKGKKLEMCKRVQEEICNLLGMYIKDEAALPDDKGDHAEDRSSVRKDKHDLVIPVLD